MTCSLDFHTSRDRLLIPGLAGFYESLAMPLGWLLLRVALGGWLIDEGWPKIIDPMGQVGYYDRIGFHPGWLFSPFVAFLSVGGGLALLLGFYTRAFAFANAILLFVTVWYHFNFPYNEMVLLTGPGIDAIKAHAEYITPNGAKRLADGGKVLLDLMEHKAVQLSSIWGFGCLFFAAFGGGPLSVDRLLRKSF